LKIGNIFKGDKVIWMVFFFLCMISIVEVFSASSNLTYKTQNYMGPIFYHCLMLAMGFVVTVVTLLLPCRYFKLFTPILILLSYVTLLWVLVGGESINGANRVITLFGGITFQPSEIAKGTMVLVTAQILSAMQRENGADRRALTYILIVVLPAVILIGLENLSTACLLVGVVFLMMVIGRVPTSQLLKLCAAGILFVAVLLSLILTVGAAEGQHEKTMAMSEMVDADGTKMDRDAIKHGGITHRFSTWRSRILDMVGGHADVPPEEYDLEKNYQVGHAKIAIATSGIIGKGPGNSTERDFLPQAFSDFIYAIIIEETGIFGASFVVLLYVILLWRAWRIASRCENNFPAFLMLGLTLMLVMQALFNMMVAVRLGPVTGQPLPLISKGGTSTIINCAYLGAILSVSRSAKMRKNSKEK
jgi:cell division protein FtsW